jgi:hypothetical protein
MYVGCNENSPEILQVFRKYLDWGRIDALVESPRNLNKDRMMRILLEFCETPYVLWLDDDSHVLPDWDEHLLQFIADEHPFDVGGHVFFFRSRSAEYLEFLRARPWSVAAEREQSPIWFATGALYLARTAFLRQHNYPDRGMVKRAGDVLLGELCQQQQAVLKDFGKCRAVMDRLRIGDGNRRGHGEDAQGWRKVDPLTGEAN